ncbi:receptor like protein 14 [Euphorbia peplus]|nr:receptor like protein 14 [Euphorbia peplus]
MKTCNGCFEDERVALLQLKSSFNSSAAYFWGITEEDDCCKWEGVECSSSTGRLIGISLLGSYMAMEWKMNASLFFPFQQLTSLSLHAIYISGSVHNQSIHHDLESQLVFILFNIKKMALNYKDIF